MKKLRILLATTLSLALVSVTPLAVFAESGSGSGGTTTTNSTSGSNGTSESESETEKSVDDSNLTPEQKAALEAARKKRIDDNKTALKTKLTETRSKKIIAKCKGSQVIVKGAATSAKAVTSNRGKAYSKIAEKVQEIIDKVKAKGIDTTALEAANKEAKLKADTLAASMKTYDQMLVDLQAMDCAADPAGFQATLEKARTQRDLIKTQANDLRTYISTTLKKALQDVKKQLEATETSTKPETENSTDDNSTTTTGGTR